MTQATAQPVFRAANRADLPQLVAMLADDELGARREDATEPLNPAYAAAFKHIDSDPNNALIIAEIDLAVVGMMQLTFIPYLTHTGSWRCLVEGVRVASGYRGLGIGGDLLRFAISAAGEKNCHLVQLTSDKQRPQALHFYESLGFKATHEGFKLKL